MQKRFQKIGDIVHAIEHFECEEFKLIGLKEPDNYTTLSKQIADSIRRIIYIQEIGKKEISANRKNPYSNMFDPLRAAWLHIRDNNKNEAYWLIFLATHFGKHKKEGWKLCANIYGGLGTDVWTWERVSHNPKDFSLWFMAASVEIKRIESGRKFGNHRKYESLSYNSSRPLQTVIETYVDWVGVSKDHETKFLELLSSNNTKNSYELFDAAYHSMRGVLSFGRTAKFDYLTMLKKFSLQDIEPQNLYLSGATGPKTGASLLFFGKKDSNCSIEELNRKLNLLAKYLPIDILSSQVLEDALCNWQKSPSTYQYFGG